MTIDPKTLEAVAEALSQYDRPVGAAFELEHLSYGEKQHYLEKAEAAINAHLDAADLVPRQEANEWIKVGQRSVNKVCVCIFAEDETVEHWCSVHAVVRDERDEGRRQIAVLRDALKICERVLLHDAAPPIDPRGDNRIYQLDGALLGNCLNETIRPALANTAEAEDV